MSEDPILTLRSSRPRPDLSVLEVNGELDGSTVPRLRAGLDAADTPHLAVDLGGVSFVDSSGVEALVRANTQHPGTLHLVGAQRSRAVTRVLDLFGITAEFSRHDDVDALLAALDPA